MAKRLQEYVKYTTKELDIYTETEGSCVSKINTNLHLSMGPFCLADFKHILMAHLVRSKVGFYDIHLDGIVLDVKKIKVLGTTGALRADDPHIHVDINADVYVFKPEEGAILTGVVKHIGPHQVGVILYRVFNANLRVAQKFDKEEVQMDQEVKFRIRKYNLQNVFPYIDGELLTPKSERALAKGKRTIFKQEDNTDSGIEEKDGTHELDDLLSLIKTESTSEDEDTAPKNQQKKSKTKSKKARASSEDSDVSESSTEKSKKPKNANDITGTTESTGMHSAKSKKARASSEDSDVSESSTEKSKKPKNANDITGTTESTGMLSASSIKREVTSSDDSFHPKLKKIKKEKDSCTSKKHKKKDQA